MNHAEKLKCAITVKSADLLSQVGGKLKNFFTAANKYKSTPLFGRELANRAKQHGTILVGDYEGEVSRLARSAKGGQLFSGPRSLFSRIGFGRNKPDSFIDISKDRMTNEIRSGVNAVGGRNFKGVVLDPTNTPVISKVLRSAAPNSFVNKAGPYFKDKFEEAASARGMLPKTVAVEKILRKYKLTLEDLWRNPEAIKKVLSKELGPNYIAKPIDAAGVAGGDLPTNLSKADDIVDNLTHGVWSAANEESYGLDLSKWMAQERLKLKPHGVVGQASNAIYDAISHKDPDAIRNFFKYLTGKTETYKGMGSVTGNGRREFRVHTMNGKVIPYATYDRGSMLHLLNPWHTQRMTEAEVYAQSILDKLPKKYRNTPYGMDVAQTTDGKFRAIELNPAEGRVPAANGFSAGGSHSGFLESPRVQDALISATRGELPTNIKIQKGVTIAGRAAIPAAGVYGAHRLISGNGES